MKGRIPIAAFGEMARFSIMDYEHAIDLYTAGFCHVFAIASVRKHGGSFLIVEDTEETWWEFDDEAEQNAIVHIYAVHDTPDGPIARDIRGDRPLDQVLDDVKDFFGTHEPSYGGDVSCLEELMDLIEGPHNRSSDMDPPLMEFSEGDILEANTWVDWLPYIETDFPVRTDILTGRETPSADEPQVALAFGA